MVLIIEVVDALCVTVTIAVRYTFLLKPGRGRV